MTVIVGTINDRYEYDCPGIVFTGPHIHTRPIGCEPAGSDCAGCWEAPEGNRTVSVIITATRAIKGTFRTQDVELPRVP